MSSVDRIQHLVETIGKYCGVKVNVVPGELRAGGTPRRCPAIGKLRELGYEPKYSFEQLVERCVTGYISYYKQEAGV